jgi:hypothetical protein
MSAERPDRPNGDPLPPTRGCAGSTRCVSILLEPAEELPAPASQHGRRGRSPRAGVVTFATAVLQISMTQRMTHGRSFW